ncbi:MAG TPA: GNAT family N-acetyltransferase, partial [Blastocatellia bacterium]|nr:GNAT family N-acetyltransferase [Blastocatellia bacterium]
FRTVMPLRVDLSKFAPSRSQRRALTRNSDLRVVIRDTFIDEVKKELFYRHRERFKENVPDSIYDFLSEEPAVEPCRNHEICLYDGDRLLAASFLDVGGQATSAVYAMFEPSESRRSLGVFTMLESIRYSRELGCKYYYPGYAYREPSVYDYKKNFAGSEYYDWKEGWKPFLR